MLVKIDYKSLSIMEINGSLLIMVAKMQFVSDIIEFMKANRMHLENFIS